MLAHAVTNPIEAHVNGFGSALFDRVVDNTGGAGIVGLDRCGRLRMAHVMECSAEPSCILSIVEEGAQFGFRGRGEDDGHDAAGHVDGAIEGRWWAVRERGDIRIGGRELRKK